MTSTYGMLSRFVLVIGLLSSMAGAASAGFVTFGDGAGSKWDVRDFGNPAIITWGFMPDGTTVDPGVFIAAEVMGGSDITLMRSSFDATYGAGAFDTAIQNALDTWESVANIKFVGPIADPNPGSPLPVGATGAIVPDIRIGAFDPVPLSGFDFVGGVGFGPPGDDINFPDPLAGDIMFNIDATFIMPAGDEDDPIVEFGNDLENLTLHELGHAAIGLGHPDDGPGDVMYVGTGCCDFINHIPSADDIAGAWTVYGIPGDISGDGQVDIGDFTLWADAFGDTGVLLPEDVSLDGQVDIGDFTLWADAFGNTLAPSGPSSAPTAVPEPGSFVLLLIGLSVCAIRAVRRQRR